MWIAKILLWCSIKLISQQWQGMTLGLNGFFVAHAWPLPTWQGMTLGLNSFFDAHAWPLPTFSILHSPVQNIQNISTLLMYEAGQFISHDKAWEEIKIYDVSWLLLMSVFFIYKQRLHDSTIACLALIFFDTYNEHCSFSNIRYMYCLYVLAPESIRTGRLSVSMIEGHSYNNKTIQLNFWLSYTSFHLKFRIANLSQLKLAISSNTAQPWKFTCVSFKL